MHGQREEFSADQVEHAFTRLAFHLWNSLTPHQRETALKFWKQGVEKSKDLYPKVAKTSASNTTNSKDVVALLDDVNSLSSRFMNRPLRTVKNEQKELVPYTPSRDRYSTEFQNQFVRGDRYPDARVPLLLWLAVRHKQEWELLLRNAFPNLEKLKIQPPDYPDPTIAQFLRARAPRIEQSNEAKGARGTSGQTVARTDDGKVIGPHDQSSLIQPCLSKAEQRDGLLHFASPRSLPIVGREKEQDRLRAFLDCKSTFCWMQLAGAAGQGKSRLAYELLQERQDDWICGFIDKQVIHGFEGAWSKWQPSRPYLLIADYVIGNEEALGQLVSDLLNRQVPLKNKVRLLFVERQRWDRGGIKSIQPGKAGVPTEIELYADETAHWFAVICKSIGSSRRLIDCAYADEKGSKGLEELKSLSLDLLTDLACKIVEDKTAVVHPSPHLIRKQILNIDPSGGRPIYSYLLGQIIAEDPSKVFGRRETLLDSTLNKDWRTRWPKMSSQSPPHLGDDIPAMHIAILATILGGIDIGKYSRTLRIPKSMTARQDWELASIINNGPLREENIRQPSSIIPPLLPDLLGGWFVLSAMKGGTRCQELIKLALVLDSESASAFLLRLSQDFPESEITQELLSSLSEEDVGFISEAAILGIISILHVSGMNAPIYMMRKVKQSADRGDINSKTIFGLCSLIKSKSFEEQEEAVNYLRQSAAAGDSSAMSNIGVAYAYGCGTDHDEAAAVHWYRKASDKGHINATNSLGACYFNGQGITQDKVEAFNLFVKAAAADHPRAMLNVGTCFAGGHGVARNPIKALEWYLKAANAGDVMALCKLGVCYAQGDGVDQDPAKALSWFLKGAYAGDAKSMINVGMAYAKGFGVPINPAEAVEWYIRAAHAGEESAMFNVGVAYSEGAGVEKDEVKAIEWYKKAASAGVSDAMYNLGIAYSLGLGVDKSAMEAFNWYLKAAHAGYVDAMYNVGVSYSQGLGVDPNEQQAMQWFAKAVKEGHLNSQRELEARGGALFVSIDN